jgi:hypothetical protein
MLVRAALPYKKHSENVLFAAEFAIHKKHWLM